MSNLTEQIQEILLSDNTDLDSHIQALLTLIENERREAAIEELNRARDWHRGIIFEWDGGVRFYTGDEKKDAELNKGSDDKIARQESEYRGYDAAIQDSQRIIDAQIAELSNNKEETK